MRGVKSGDDKDEGSIAFTRIVRHVDSRLRDLSTSCTVT